PTGSSTALICRTFGSANTHDLAGLIFTSSSSGAGNLRTPRSRRSARAGKNTVSARASISQIETITAVLHFRWPVICQSILAKVSTRDRTRIVHAAGHARADFCQLHNVGGAKGMPGGAKHVSPLT